MYNGCTQLTEFHLNLQFNQHAEHLPDLSILFGTALYFFFLLLENTL